MDAVGSSSSTAVSVCAAVVRPKRPPVRHHLEQHRAHAEDVGAVIGRQPARLLRTEIADGLEHGAGRRVRGSREGDRVEVHQLGEAEVEDLEPLIARDEDVLRLQVAMDDAFVVCGR
jgi:hypothetical protein